MIAIHSTHRKTSNSGTPGPDEIHYWLLIIKNIPLGYALLNDIACSCDKITTLAPASWAEMNMLMILKQRQGRTSPWYAKPGKSHPAQK